LLRPLCPLPAGSSDDEESNHGSGSENYVEDSSAEDSGYQYGEEDNDEDGGNTQVIGEKCVFQF
jgi:hypothetical protein